MSAYLSSKLQTGLLGQCWHPVTRTLSRLVSTLPWLSSHSMTHAGLQSVRAQLPSRVWLLTTPWTAAHQAPLCMGFSRQEYWNELPFPPPGDLPDPGIEPVSPELQVDSSPLSHQRSLVMCNSRCCVVLYYIHKPRFISIPCWWILFVVSSLRLLQAMSLGAWMYTSLMDIHPGIESVNVHFQQILPRISTLTGNTWVSSAPYSHIECIPSFSF